MHILVSTIHIFVCFFLIIVILLQSGKAGDIASAFGGMGSQTAFGPRGAQTALGKATIVCAVIFMFTSIGLALLANRSRPGNGSLLQNTPAKSAPAPVKPAPAPVKK